MNEYPNEKIARTAAEVAAVEIRKILAAYDAELSVNYIGDIEQIVLITYYGDPGEGKFVEAQF